MRRFWLGRSSPPSPGECEITEDTFHHVIDVCRMQVGHRFELMTTDHMALLVELISVGKKSAICREVSRRELSRPHGPRLHLCLSIPKFQTFEEILEKCVELGVTSVRPFFSDYSFIKSLQKVSPERIKRWQKIIQSATQQSNRGDLLVLEVPTPLSDLFRSVEPGPSSQGLFCYEGVASTSLGEALRQWPSFPELQDVYIFIGSEGGFSDREVQLFQDKGFNPVTLGEQILRVETACLAVVSAIKYQTRAFG